MSYLTVLDDRFILKILTSLKDVSLDKGTSESYFQSRAFDEVVG
jgi:hypothetical protein